MTKPSLKKQILRTLHQSPLPMTTLSLIILHALNKPNARAQVHVVLRQLANAGLIKRCGKRKNETEIYPKKYRPHTRITSPMTWQATKFKESAR